MNVMSIAARSLILLTVFAGASLAANYPGNIIDQLTLRAVRTVVSAEITYFVTTGSNNSYGKSRVSRRSGAGDLRNDWYKVVLYR